MIDASFIQFDYFIPILKTIRVLPASLEIKIQFDSGDLTLTPTFTEITTNNNQLDIYGANDRFLGTLVFGAGFDTLITQYMNQTKTFNIAFSPVTLIGIPKASGVYSINGVCGDVTVNTGTTLLERSIMFDVVGSAVAWNALALPALSTDPILKTLNKKTPVNNNIWLIENDLIKIRGISGGLEVYVAGDQSNLTPTTKYV